MVKRKSPVQHTVKQHKRDGKTIKSFERGKGKRISKKKRVVGGGRSQTQNIPRVVSSKIPEEWEATRNHFLQEHSYLPLGRPPQKIIGQDIFYHITSDRNLKHIAKDGLIPKWDANLDAAELPEGTLINLLLSEHDVEFVLPKISGIMLRRHGRDYFPVILRVVVDNAYLVHGAPHAKDNRYVWAITADRIPPENIDIFDVPWQRQKPYLREIKDEWEANIEVSPR